MTEKHRNQYRLVMAGGGVAAAVAMAVLGPMMVPSSSGGAPFGEAPKVSAGETSTETHAPTEIETTFAEPPVKVELPDGYGNG